MIILYEKYPVPGRRPGTTAAVYRPMARVRLFGPTLAEVQDEELALLDTGADDTLVPDYLAGFIGIELNEADRVTASGLGGKLTATFADVGLDIMVDGQRLRWVTEVGFYPGQPYRVVLGHLGFLEYLDARFHGPSRSLSLALARPLPTRALAR